MKITIRQKCDVCRCRRPFKVETANCSASTAYGHCEVCGKTSQVSSSAVADFLQEAYPPKSPLEM